MNKTIIILTSLMLLLFLGVVVFRALVPISVEEAAAETEKILSSDLFKWDFNKARTLFYSGSRIHFQNKNYEKEFLADKKKYGKIVGYSKPIGEARFKVDLNFLRPSMIHYNADVFFENDTIEIYMILIKEDRNWRIYALNLDIGYLDKENVTDKQSDEEAAKQIFGGN